MLLVDDERLIRWSMERALRGQGFEVLSATTAEEALDLLRRHRPQVVITDLRMPGMGGLGLLRALREVAPQAKAIVVTAYGTPEAEQEARRLGVTCFLHKPFSLERLAAAVEGCCG